MDIHIFTEVIRCGKIAIQAIESFHRYHPELKLNIYVGEDDIQSIPSHPNNIIHVIGKTTTLYQAFDDGHKGTSLLWTNLILELPNTVKKLIHFDSDVIFFGDAVQDILNGLNKDDLVGPIRNYVHNPNNRDDVRHLKDVVQTYCFGFNREKITMKDLPTLHNWVRGYPVNFPHQVIDFFDPVSFHILYNGGTVGYVGEDDFGGTNFFGKRTNKYQELNSVFDVGSKIIHFASVGSGLNFSSMMKEHKPIKVPISYVKFAIKRYDIYSQLFFGEKILRNNENDEIVGKMRAYLVAAAAAPAQLASASS
jgi:hypothetical protein